LYSWARPRFYLIYNPLNREEYGEKNEKHSGEKEKSGNASDSKDGKEAKRVSFLLTLGCRRDDLIQRARTAQDFWRG